MTTDDFILLVQAQWERGLIVPDRVSPLELRASASAALAAGLCYEMRYHVASGNAKCYALTRAGWTRLGELIGATVHYNG